MDYLKELKNIEYTLRFCKVKNQQKQAEYDQQVEAIHQARIVLEQLANA